MDGFDSSDFRAYHYADSAFLSVVVLLTSPVNDFCANRELDLAFRDGTFGPVFPA
jgi:hypothetical protein